MRQSSLLQISLGFVNAFIIKDQNGLTLVDTGMPGSAGKIVKAIKAAGLDPADVRRIIITHAHTDHAGSAAELQTLWKVPVWAHPDTATQVEKGLASQHPLVLTPGFANWLVWHLFVKRAPKNIDPVTIDRRLQDGEILPIAGGLRVIDTPGHASGHLSLLVEKERLLIAADICANTSGLVYSVAYEDLGIGRQSILKAAAFDFEEAVFGHGRPLKKNAANLMKAKFSGSDLRTE